MKHLYVFLLTLVLMFVASYLGFKLELIVEHQLYGLVPKDGSLIITYSAILSIVIAIGATLISIFDKNDKQ